MKVFIAALAIAILGGAYWYNSANTSQSNDSHQPVISRQDILDATDLIEGVKQGLVLNDSDAIDDWLDKAIDVAEAAELSQQDLDYLNSDDARKYVIFQAKRRLFNDAVEQAYYTLYDIDAIKGQYPEAQDLFAKADELFAARNKTLEKIAAELAQGKPVNDDFRAQALAMWKQRFADKIKADTPTL